MHDEIEGLNGKLGDVLLEPTKIYVKSVLALLDKVKVKGMAHITGGGFIENIPRVLPDHVNVDIEYGTLLILPIFQLMQEKVQSPTETCSQPLIWGLAW